MTGVLCFGGAALWDSLNGGPDARQASINAEAVVSGLKTAQERAECVTTYAVADGASDALLSIAFGRLTQSVNPDGSLSQEALNDVNDAINARLYYLSLRLQTNELCDPIQPGGSNPLTDADLEAIVAEELGVTNNGG
jgi:hypothetical protein